MGVGEAPEDAKPSPLAQCGHLRDGGMLPTQHSCEGADTTSVSHSNLRNHSNPILGQGLCPLRPQPHSHPSAWTPAVHLPRFSLL